MRLSIKKSRWLLALAVFWGFMLAWPAGLMAVERPAVCSTEDFQAFIEGYMKLSLDEQAECVVYPIEDDNVPGLATPFKNDYVRALRRLYPDIRIISAPEALVAGSQVSTPYVTFNPEEIEPVKIGYVLKRDGKQGQAILTEGGTFVYDISTFVWDGSMWRLTKVEVPEE